MPTTLTRAGDYAVEHWGKDTADAYRILLGGTQQLRWSALARGLRERAEVRALLTHALAQSPHDAYFWECRPYADGDPAFEFVLVPTTAFGRMTASPEAFEDHFYDGCLVGRFDSLGGDARLVAPAPVGRRDIALHLASFVRHASKDQIDAMWIAVGEEISAWKSTRQTTLWLSTSGLGVPWLHVRLDARPKYYTHDEYR
ncbi:MAG: hypothetical protein KDK70_34040 [Myxococcales bacterium]|nr:hypothetical protein [Myxococcales bacterium]